MTKKRFFRSKRPIPDPRTTRIPRDAGIAVELWDDDGPMTDRTAIAICWLRGAEHGIEVIVGPHHAMTIRRKGQATMAVWYPSMEAEVWFARIDLSEPIVLDDDSCWLDDTPIFGMAYDAMHGAGVRSD